jgi:hypothetical protein
MCVEYGCVYPRTIRPCTFDGAGGAGMLVIARQAVPAVADVDGVSGTAFTVALICRTVCV